MGVSALTHSNRTWNGKNGGMMVKKTILTDKEVAFGTGDFSTSKNQELVDDQGRSWFWKC